MADKERAARFRTDMQALLDEIQFQEFYSSAKAKIIDALAKGDIQGDTLYQVKRQVYKLFHPDFREFIDQIIDQYTATLATVNEHYADIGFDLRRDMQKVQALEAVNSTKLGKYEDETCKAIARIIRKGGDSWKDVAKNIEKLDGRARTYADTLARTLTKGYGREGVKIKADIAEVYWFQYVGILRPATRPFCYACVNQYFSAQEIRLSMNGHVGPVSRFAGGWNCHHDLEPDLDFTDADGDKRGFRSIEKKEGRKTIRFFGDENSSRRYDAQKKRLKK